VNVAGAAALGRSRWSPIMHDLYPTGWHDPVTRRSACSGGGLPVLWWLAWRPGVSWPEGRIWWRGRLALGVRQAGVSVLGCGGRW